MVLLTETVGSSSILHATATEKSASVKIAPPMTRPMPLLCSLVIGISHMACPSAAEMMTHPAFVANLSPAKKAWISWRDMEDVTKGAMRGILSWGCGLKGTLVLSAKNGSSLRGKTRGDAVVVEYEVMTI